MSTLAPTVPAQLSTAERPQRRCLPHTFPIESRRLPSQTASACGSPSGGISGVQHTAKLHSPQLLSFFAVASSCFHSSQLLSLSAVAIWGPHSHSPCTPCYSYICNMTTTPSGSGTSNGLSGTAIYQPDLSSAFLAQSRVGAIYAAVITVSIASTIAVALRFVCRRMVNAHLWWDDWTMLAALVSVSKVDDA